MQNKIEKLEVGDWFETENGDQYVVTKLIEKGQVAAKKLSEEEFVSIDAIKAINGTPRK